MESGWGLHCFEDKNSRKKKWWCVCCGSLTMIDLILSLFMGGIYTHKEVSLSAIFSFILFIIYQFLWKWFSRNGKVNFKYSMSVVCWECSLCIFSPERKIIFGQCFSKICKTSWKALQALMRIQSVKESTDDLGIWNMHAHTHTHVYKLTKELLDSMDNIHKISKSEQCLFFYFLTMH